MTGVSSCPCDSGRTYLQCCGGLHRDVGSAISAEALMRSRYSAYVLGLDDYILATWHPSTRPAGLGIAGSSDFESRQWLGLKVLNSQLDDSEHARVEFVARSRLAGGRADRLHESSRFVCENNQWFYLDGEIHPR